MLSGGIEDSKDMFVCSLVENHLSSYYVLHLYVKGRYEVPAWQSGFKDKLSSTCEYLQQCLPHSLSSINVVLCYYCYWNNNNICIAVGGSCKKVYREMKT